MALIPLSVSAAVPLRVPETTAWEQDRLPAHHGMLLPRSPHAGLQLPGYSSKLLFYYVFVRGSGTLWGYPEKAQAGDKTLRQTLC